jgi:TolA-binding protein
MKVVDLHPEDLIDKLAAGELTSAERTRLDAHVLLCSACRLEISVRADLEQDAPLIEQRPQLTFPSGSERTQPAPRVAASIRPRSRRRWPLVMLAAALVLCAGGATAAVVTGAVKAPWLPWASEAKGVTSAPPATGAKLAAKTKLAASKATTAIDAPPLTTEASSASLPTASAEVTPAPSAGASVAVAAHVNHAVKAEPASSALAASSTAMPSAPSAAASSPRTEEPTPRVDAAAALFSDANRARRDGNADRAVTLYRSLQTRYPSSSESELSRALLAQLLLDRGNPEAALAGFDRYLAEAAPVLGAEALVGRARALEQLGKSTQAAAAWREVQTRFAGSVHARLAAARLAALGMR